VHPKVWPFRVDSSLASPLFCFGRCARTSFSRIWLSSLCFRVVSRVLRRRVPLTMEPAPAPGPSVFFSSPFFSSVRSSVRSELQQTYATFVVKFHRPFCILSFPFCCCLILQGGSARSIFFDSSFFWTLAAHFGFNDSPDCPPHFYTRGRTRVRVLGPASLSRPLLPTLPPCVSSAPLG